MSINIQQVLNIVTDCILSLCNIFDKVISTGLTTGVVDLTTGTAGAVSVRSLVDSI